MEIVQAFIDIRRGREFRIVEEPVDILQDDRIRIDENHAVIVKLPQPQLGEIV
ncbi:hypothetical protein D3C76_1433970 [compost metagenome]